MGGHAIGPKRDFTPAADAPAPVHLGDHGNAARQDQLRSRRGAWSEDGPDATARVTGTGLEADATLGGISHRGSRVLDGAGGSARAIAWTEENGAVRVGTRASVGTGGINAHDEVQLRGPSASVDAWIGSDGLAVGAGASLAEASVQTNPEPRRDQVDHNVRGGVGEGVGLAFRAHWGDEDGDGDEEIGLGGDFGPVTFDATSEDWTSFASDGGLPSARERPARAPRAAPVPFSSTPAEPAATGPAAMVAPTTPSAGPSWDRESQASQLANRTGRPMSSLMRLGPDGTYVYDERAESAAIRQVQRESGLPVTGQMDPATQAALGR